MKIVHRNLLIVAAFAACSCGAAASLGEAFTHAFHFTDILRKCDIRNSSYYQFEVSVYIVVNSLKLMAYIIFLVTSLCSLLYYSGKQIVWKNTTTFTKITKISRYSVLFYSVEIIFLFFMAVFAVGVPIFGFDRDRDYYHDCRDVTILIVWFHTGFKATDLACGWVLCTIAVFYSWQAIRKWKSVPVYNNNYPDASQADKRSRALERVVNERYLFLYESYHTVGRNIGVEMHALKYWFCVQYLAFLISLTFRVIHILKPYFSTSGYFKNIPSDIEHSAIYICYDFIAFSVPFCVGLYLNYAHHSFHNHMLNDFLSFKVVKTGRIIYRRMLQGSYFFDDNQPYFPEHEELRKLDYKYKFYTMKASEKDVTKRNEFDFVPSLFGVSIPLDSPGYTFSILITFTTIIFSFIGVE